MPRADLLRKLESLRRAARSVGERVLHLDFSRTEKLHAEGTLLFVAVLRSLLVESPQLSVSCAPSTNDKVCQVFEQIGLRQLLGLPKSASPKDDDVVHWRFTHGSSVEGERYEDVLAEYDDRLAAADQELLFTGITEAMTNVINHAYLNSQGAEHRGGWWMFSQMKGAILSVVICDLGLGIPGTLQQKRPAVWQRFLLLGRQRHASAIEYAVTDSVSRTQMTHRGKGLGQIVSLATSIQEAEVAVFSNRGMYVKSPARATKRNYRDSIMGTLIYWKIPLADKEQS